MKQFIRYLFISIISVVLPLVGKAQVSADFTSNVDSGCGYLAVTFTDLSTGNPVAWNWDFGDGNTSTFQNPSTFYSIPGSYTVTLTVTDGNGNKNTIAKPAFISVHKLPNPKFGSDVAGGCVPLPVNFTDQTVLGNASVQSWLWDFGDGSFSTSQNPSHTYGSVGTYQVALEVVDSLGCTKKKVVSSFISVQNLPSVSFTVSASLSCTIPFTVAFTNTSGSSALTYSWDFGDGGTSTQTSPSHTYVAFGTYSVILTGTDSTGCANTYGPISITVSPFSSNFSLSATAACINTQITFVDQSSPSPSSWNWDFGDGSTSTQQNPTHTYASTGTFTVTLTSSTTLGCADTIVKSVSVYPLPVVDFSVDDQTACTQPFTPTFTDNTPNAMAWQWDINVPQQSLGLDTFGIDYSSQTFTHTYDSSGGIFTVRLVVTDTNGCMDTLTKFDYINNYKPYASFIQDKTSGCIPLIVNFTDLSWSNENIVSWSWDFGDPLSGASNSSSLQNPIHTYNDTGSYYVTFSFTDAGGCTKSNGISIVSGIPPVTNFYILDSSICYAGDLAVFDSSSSYTNGWAWGYAIGTDSTYLFPNPSSAPSYYAEDLITVWTADTGYFGISHVALFNGCPGDTVSRPAYFYVNLPKAIFLSSPSTFCEKNTPYTITITDLSQGADTYFWDFGDPASGVNNTSTDSIPPQHTYTSPGQYTINLMVTNDSSGCVHETSSSVFISNIDISITTDTTPLTGCNPSAFTIQNTTTANEGISYWGWFFGDSQLPANWYDFYSTYADYDLVFNSFINLSNDTIYLGTDSVFAGTYANPYHRYDSAGVFSIRLVVVGAGSGCIDTLTLQDAVRIYETPSAFYQQDLNTGCAPLPVNFTDTSAQGDAPIVAWDWNFGDGNTDTLQNPLHVFQTAGTYPVTLTVTDTNNCSGGLTKNYEVIVTKPAPNFSTNSFYCYYDNIAFSNTSVGSSLSYVWDFGDGSPLDSSNNPVHHYTIMSDTLFTVSLYAVDINGCDSSITKQIDIRRPYAGFYLTDLNNNCPPFFATFIDTSSTLSNWYYNFGDGSTATFTSYADADTLSHVFNTSGVYDVTLIVRDAAGCYDTLFLSEYVKVDGPLGEFDYNPKDGCAPLDVSFMPSNIYNAATFTWIFGDGSSSYAKDTVVHTYNQAGTYIPVLILEDSLNYALGDSITCVLTLIPDTNLFIIGPDVDFEMIGEDTSCTAYSVTFTNYTNPPDSVNIWVWNFGDGTVSYDMNPTHYYANVGTYDVTLQAFIYNPTDTCIYTITKEDLVTVFDPPQVSYILSDVDSCPPLLVSFTVSDASVTFPATSYSWDFGDGQFSTDQNPTHMYDSSGSYTVNLTVNYENGCDASYPFASSVQIYPDPTADFTISPEINGTQVSYLQFNNSSVGATTYFWNFGDGGTSTEENPQYEYEKEGEYQIQLIAVNEYGCSDTTTNEQYIYLEPQLSNTFTPNGDGHNDLFVIQITGYLENLWLKVYDRWGKLVYEKEDYMNDWNGSDMNGKPLPPDTYYYIVNYQNKTVWAGWLRIF